MLRRTARERRDYIYKKSFNARDQAINEKKRKVRDALNDGRVFPTELRHEQNELRKEIELDDAGHEDVKTHIDDEYANAGVTDPRILLTTSRAPSSRLKAFAKEMKLVFPNCERVNRGGTVLGELVDTCRTSDVTDLIILHEHRGEPDGMIVCHLPYGPTAYFGLYNCVLRHDIPDGVDTMSLAYPHLVFNNFTTPLGQRCSDILKYLFPVPSSDESRRVITFANQNDFISFRHHTYKKLGHNEIDLSEVGPRFEMKLYQIKLGTIDQSEAENEWVLRPYMNTAHKRKRL